MANAPLCATAVLLRARFAGGGGLPADSRRPALALPLQETGPLLFQGTSQSSSSEGRGRVGLGDPHFQIWQGNCPRVGKHAGAPRLRRWRFRMEGWKKVQKAPTSLPLAHRKALCFKMARVTPGLDPVAVRQVAKAKRAR